MATKLVKNYLMAIVAMVMVVGFSAFKLKTDVITEHWFEVVKINPSGGLTATNLRIVGDADTPSDQPDEENCAIPNTGEVCSVRMDLSAYTGDPEDLHDKTIAQAAEEDAYILPGNDDLGFAFYHEED